MNKIDVLNSKISFQSSVKSPISKNITVRDALDYIKEGVYRNQVENLRDFIRKGQIDIYNASKGRLPAVTFSGSFFSSRNRANIDSYSNLLVLDIDKLSISEMSALKEYLINDEYVFAFWTSPSMSGLKGLVNLEYDHEFKEVDINIKHSYAFKKVSEYFLLRYNIKLDHSGSDTTRLCFFSADSDLHEKNLFNTYRVEFSEEEIEKTFSKERAIKSLSPQFVSRDIKYNPKGKNDPNIRNEMRAIIRFLTKNKKSITCDYNNWYQVSYAIANTFTYDIGLKYFLSLSKQDIAKYNEQECIDLLEYCYGSSLGSFTFGTILYFSKEVGYKQRKEVLKAEELL